VKSVVLACLWVIVAHVLLLFPSKDRYWRAAYALIAIGLPILGYVVYENGVIFGILVLAGAMSILRWPVIYAWRRLRRTFHAWRGER